MARSGIRCDSHDQMCGSAGTIWVRQYSRVSTRHEKRTTTNQNRSITRPRLL